MKIRHPVVIGAIVGITFASAIAVLAQLNNNWDNEALRTAINFLVSVPAFALAARFHASGMLINILFFVNWILVGGVAGWLLGRKNMVSKILLIVLIVSLAISHQKTQANIERGLSALADTVGASIKELFK